MYLYISIYTCVHIYIYIYICAGSSCQTGLRFWHGSLSGAVGLQKLMCVFVQSLGLGILASIHVLRQIVDLLWFSVLIYVFGYGIWDSRFEIMRIVNILEPTVAFQVALRVMFGLGKDCASDGVLVEASVWGVPLCLRPRQAQKR